MIVGHARRTDNPQHADYFIAGLVRGGHNRARIKCLAARFLTDKQAYSVRTDAFFKQEQNFTLFLEGFEQCWLTGTAAEVTPVGQIGDYTFEVGALARDIAESYEKLVRA